MTTQPFRDFSVGSVGKLHHLHLMSPVPGKLLVSLRGICEESPNADLASIFLFSPGRDGLRKFLCPRLIEVAFSVGDTG
jgi:hypothetical protein